MREALIAIFCVIFLISYVKLGWNLKDKDILYLAVIALMFGLMVVISLTLIVENNRLEELTKNKCPEYEKIENVYVIKK